MSERRLGFGVVGINQRVRRSILAGLAQSRYGRLAAICSRDSEKAARTAEEFGCAGYTSLDALLADPSVLVVFICTPHHLHYPMSLQALAAGKRVVCEKPLAINVAEAAKLATVADQSRLSTAVNFTYRSMSGHRLVERLLTEGAIGTIHYLSLTYWQARQALPGAKPGDVLFEVGSHLIDLASWWLDSAGGGAIESVVSLSDGRQGDRSVVWASLARTSTHAVVQLQANRVAAGWRNGMECRLVGDRGTIELTFDTDRVAVRAARLHDGSPEGTWQPIEIPADLTVSYQDFPRFHIDRIAESLLGEIAFPDFAAGLRCQMILDAMRVSGHERRWVDLTEITV